jgi:hypothetical protein
MRRFALSLLALLAILPICVARGADPSAMAPASFSCESAGCGGEFRLVIPEDLYQYHFGWNGIPAFDGTIQATRHEDARAWYHFRLVGKTRRWLDFIYRMRDTMDAYVDGANYLPRFFQVRMSAPRKKTDLTVRFNHARRVAHATWVTNGKEKVREIPFRRANDPVTVIYLLQKLRAPGDEATFEVVNGRANYQVGLRVVGRERVKVRAGTFDTLVLEPTLTRLDKPNYKPKFKKMTIWVTEGETRIPVKLRSEVFIGSVSGELVKITPRDTRASHGFLRRLPL